MKNCLTIIALLIFVSSVKSQDSTVLNRFKIKDNKACYERIVEFNSMTKEKIYSKLKEKLTKIFIAQKANLQVDEKEQGLISYQANTFVLSFEYPKGRDLYWRKPYYNISFFIKDGKCKIFITDIEIEPGEENYRIRYPIETFESVFFEKGGWRESYLKTLKKLNAVFYDNVNAEFLSLLDTIESTIKEKSEMDF